MILSEINMPGMSGLELLEHIKKNYLNPAPVVMMITAYGDEENYYNAKRLGADAFLRKPLAVRSKINSLPGMHYEKEEFNPKVSIGIKSGEMISGNIGSASLKRLDYTVIGDTVNTAARLQGVAKENQIVICEDCYKKVKESFRCDKIGSISLKNKVDPIIIYEVLE